MLASAIRVFAIVADAADCEEGPSRRIRRVRDAVGGGLEEVDLVFGRAVRGTGEDDEELEKDGAGEENPGRDGEDRA